jgi:hypothetical protein
MFSVIDRYVQNHTENCTVLSSAYRITFYRKSWKIFCKQLITAMCHDISTICLITFLINRQALKISTLISFSSHVFKLWRPKVISNNTISVACLMPDKTPCSPPYSARSTTPHFPKHYICLSSCYPFVLLLFLNFHQPDGFTSEQESHPSISFEICTSLSLRTRSWSANVLGT